MKKIQKIMIALLAFALLFAGVGSASASNGDEEPLIEPEYPVCPWIPEDPEDPEDPVYPVCPWIDPVPWDPIIVIPEEPEEQYYHESPIVIPVLPLDEITLFDEND